MPVKKRKDPYAEQILESDYWICKRRLHASGPDDISCWSKAKFAETPQVTMGQLGEKNIPGIKVVTDQFMMEYINRRPGEQPPDYTFYPKRGVRVDNEGNMKEE